jgi:hypothetical protein
VYQYYWVSEPGGLKCFKELSEGLPVLELALPASRYFIKTVVFLKIVCGLKNLGLEPDSALPRSLFRLRDSESAQLIIISTGVYGILSNFNILPTSCCRSEKEKAELTASCQQLKLSSESVKAQLTGLELQLAELRAATNTSSAVLDDSLEAGDILRKEVS